MRLVVGFMRGAFMGRKRIPPIEYSPPNPESDQFLSTFLSAPCPSHPRRRGFACRLGVVRIVSMVLGETASRLAWKRKSAFPNPCPLRRPSHRPACFTWENAPGWARSANGSKQGGEWPCQNDSLKNVRGFPKRRRLAVRLNRLFAGDFRVGRFSEGVDTMRGTHPRFDNPTLPHRPLPRQAAIPPAVPVCQGLALRVG